MKICFSKLIEALFEGASTSVIPCNPSRLRRGTHGTSWGFPPLNIITYENPLNYQASRWSRKPTGPCQRGDTGCLRSKASEEWPGLHFLKAWHQGRLSHKPTTEHRWLVLHTNRAGSGLSTIRPKKVVGILTGQREPRKGPLRWCAAWLASNQAIMQFDAFFFNMHLFICHSARHLCTLMTYACFATAS